MSALLIIVGSLIFANGVYMLFVANMNLGVLLTVLLGALLLLWGITYKRAKKALSRGFLRVLKLLFVFALCAEFAFAVLLTVYSLNDTATYCEDAAIVLGAGLRGDKITLPLKYRLDKAVEYYGKNPDTVIIVSGGQGPGETVTEAFAMEEYLLLQGVPKENIIKEERATSTAENMRYSKEILDALFEKEYKTAIITNNFHIYRAQALAKREGLENITHLHAPLQIYNIFPCYLRESLAVMKMWILG